MEVSKYIKKAEQLRAEIEQASDHRIRLAARLMAGFIGFLKRLQNTKP